MPDLMAHPRLLVSAAARDRLRRPVRDPRLRRAAVAVARRAEDSLASPEFAWKRNIHNAHLLRAREMQGRVVTLITRFFQTGDRRYRDAALAHLLEMGRWEDWSWIAWRQGNTDPNAVYDLSYGENNATLALGFDLLFDVLSEDERQAVVRVARRGVDCFLHHTDTGREAGWFGRPDSNWNTVCAGGAGVLALAMHEYLPEAETILARVEHSFRPYMDELQRTDGAWCEGIGYWNYGMRYAFLYLLSHERATGHRHPLLRRAATRRTLSFPLDFSCHGYGCSFGDANGWSPQAFHWAAAATLGETAVLAALDRRLAERAVRPGAQQWPVDAELLLLRPEPPAPARPAPSDGPVARFYRGLGWASLADRKVDPRLFATIRGGTSEVPHGHLDLSSFHLVADGRHFITNLGPKEYLDTTFSTRRWELFEMAPASKNVLLVNGVGMAHPARAAIKTCDLPCGPGFRVVMTEAMGGSRDGAAVRFQARLFLLIEGRALLVVDRVICAHVARFEQRFFTPARIALGEAGAALTLGRRHLGMACAADIPTRLDRAQALMTTPTAAPPTAVRHASCEQAVEATLATVFTLDDRTPELAVTGHGRRLTIALRSAAVSYEVQLSDRLLPPRRR